MSDNPFSDSAAGDTFQGDSTNPYRPAATSQLDTEADPRTRLLIPAIFLIILATLMCSLSLLQIPRVMSEAADNGGLPYVVGTFLPAVMNLAIICGAVQMIRMKSYSSAMTAAILSVIPVCSPCIFIGIPFGIWAIIVLRDPKVKARFQ
ncbi:MAG: hypothetical protein H8E66_29370 [Planctomycetes bacterium]|nr:hypothetical protein [Planctomycetota bacterium]